MDNVVLKQSKTVFKIILGLSVVLLIPFLTGLGVLINNLVINSQNGETQDITGSIIAIVSVALFIIGLVVANIISYCILKNGVCVLTEDRIIVKYKQKVKAEILFSNVEKCVCGFSTMIYCKQPYICSGWNKGATAYQLYLTDRDCKLLQSKISYYNYEQERIKGR